MDDLDALEKEVSTGDAGREEKIFMLQRINNYRNKIKDGHIDIDEATQFKKDTNNYIAEGKTPYLAKKNYLPRFVNMQKKVLQEWGEKNAPEAWEQFRDADLIHGGQAQFHAINNRLSHTLKEQRNNWAWAGALILNAPKYGADMLQLMATNPGLHKAYVSVLKGALRDNDKVLYKALDNLDKEAHKVIPKMILD